MTICQCVAMRVKDLLKERNMTQYRLEKNSGIQHGAMNRIMRCENKGIELGTVIMIANGFDMSVVEFLDHPIFSLDEMEIE